MIHEFDYHPYFFWSFLRVFITVGIFASIFFILFPLIVVLLAGDFSISFWNYLVNKVQLIILMSIPLSFWAAISDLLFTKKWIKTFASKINLVDYSLKSKKDEIYFESTFKKYPIKINCNKKREYGPYVVKKIFQIEFLIQYSSESTFKLNKSDKLIVRSNSTIMKFVKGSEFKSFEDLAIILDNLNIMLTDYILEFQECNLTPRDN